MCISVVVVVFCVSSVLWAFCVYFERRVSEQDKLRQLFQVWDSPKRLPDGLEMQT